MSKLYIPEDNDKLRLNYEKNGGGCCGPASIAAIIEKKVSNINLRWSELCGHRVLSQGWTSWKHMKLILESYGYECAQKPAHKSLFFPTPSGSDYYWAEATMYTHFVAMKRIGDDWFVFCNECGWFPRPEKWPYETPGYITSYYELTKK